MRWIAEYFLAAMIWLFGVCVFSFLAVVIYRVPRHIPFVRGCSHCPDCGHRLAALDKVPVVSWLILRGRCRYCGRKISSRYIWLESSGGFIALLCVKMSGFCPEALTTFVFLGLLAVVAFIDIDTMKISNGTVFALLLTGVISVVTMPGLSLMQRLAGMGCVSLPLFLITLVVPDAFGGGDIKLMGACGLLLGWERNFVALFLAVIAGGAYGMFLLVTGRKGRKEHFAFGPFLCLGMFFSLFWGKPLLDWYLRLCGL